MSRQRVSYIKENYQLRRKAIWTPPIATIVHNTRQPFLVKEIRNSTLNCILQTHSIKISKKGGRWFVL